MRVHGSVSTSALVHNLSMVRKIAPSASVMGVIKANAYGHGAVAVAKVLEPIVDAFAVATVEEAVELRESGIQKRLCVLSGFTNASELFILQAHAIEVVIYCNEQIDIIDLASLQDTVPVWVKFNTGMNRLGFPIHRAAKILQRIRSNARLIHAGVMSHFACADNLDSDITLRQIELFSSCLSNFSVERSIANSAGILRWPNSHLDWVRPGIMLFGASPFPSIPARKLELRPVMNLYSQIIAVNHLQKGDGVGYGHTWKSQGTTRIGIVACGYGDGYLRSASPEAQVMIDGRYAKVVGAVSMDSIAVDLGSHPDSGVGTSVKLFGEGLPVEEVAKAAGTIPYEILVSAGPRRIQIMNE